MRRTLRALLLLGLAGAGAWTVRRVLVERSQRAARRQAWMAADTAALAPSSPHPLPAAPVLRDADVIERASATLTPVEPPVEPTIEELVIDEPPIPDEPPGPAGLEEVRERLAAIDTDTPPAAAAEAATAPRRARRARAWIGPREDGGCRETHPVKVKMKSGLFHLPGMLAYDRTHADRCYRTAEDAVADGFEPSKR